MARVQVFLHKRRSSGCSRVDGGGGGVGKGRLLGKESLGTAHRRLFHTLLLLYTLLLYAPSINLSSPLYMQILPLCMPHSAL